MAVMKTWIKRLFGWLIVALVLVAPASVHACPS